MALTTVSSDRLSTNVKNTNFTAAEKQDLTDDILPLAGQLGNRNLIINGAMQVAQRGTSDSGITSSEYADGPDRYKLGGSSFGTVTVSQSTDSPNDFGNSYKVDVTTANGSLSAGSLLEIQQSLEGQDVQDFAKGTSDAKQYALSFHVKSTKNGTYVVMLLDHDNNRMCCKTYTVSDANWNKYTLIFPADTTGAFDNDNAKSFSVKFQLVAGTTFTSGSLQTTWGAAANANSRVGQVNFADSTSNEWYLTGVQLEVGSVATDFEHLSFADELLKCQRYFQIFAAPNGEFTRFGLAASLASNSVRIPIPHITEMRSKASFSYIGGNGDYQLPGSSNGFNISQVIYESNTSSTRSTCLQNGYVSVTTYNCYQFSANGQSNNAALLFSAEL
jgi:hypothetical protein